MEKWELGAVVTPEKPPRETEMVKFVRIQSPLLSQFRGHPVFLRAGVILPRDYDRNPDRRYPLWVRIGGLDDRYTRVAELMDEGTRFRGAWMAADAPRMVLLHLDGAGSC